MSWLRLDDGFTHHPKFEGWSKEQRWNWLEVMEYCARYDTGGRIPRDRSLLPKSAAETLLLRALKSGWIDVKRGADGEEEWWIHDWSKYNPPDPTKALRQAKWRARKRLQVDGAVDVDVDGSERLQETLTRAFSPSPIPPQTPPSPAVRGLGEESDADGEEPPDSRTVGDALARRLPPPPEPEPDPEAAARLAELRARLGFRQP